MQVEFRNINKHFGSVHANKDISLIIPSGTIQGLLGENGAGKSTLMKVLSGFITQDSGELLLNGRVVEIDNPSDAINHGIGMLHQDPLDFPPMRVIDNFILGAGGGIFPNRGAAVRALKQTQSEFDFSLDPNEYVDALTVGERQQLEIIRLLWLGADVLILDEPTTGISAPQKVKLFAALKKLAAEGKTIIFVSHKLDEIDELCDRVAVLRRGKMVGEAEPPFYTQKLVKMMFAKSILLPAIKDVALDQTRLQLSQVSLETSRLRIEGVNLDVRAGEVIGLAGMEGSGQDLFLRMCAGLLRPVSGKITLDGTNLTGRSYHTFLRSGIRFLPASRLEEGLISGLTLVDHFALMEEEQGFFVDWDDARSLAAAQIAEFNIKGRPHSTVESLSGGNQQRALSAMMDKSLKMLLLEHPTRGLDIESAIWLWSRMKERAWQEGTSFIFISADLDEILLYSDRILVFFGGKVFEPIRADETDSDQLGQLIGGVELT